MWINGRAVDDHNVITDIAPIDVLYYFDEPLIFVVNSGFPAICLKIDESETHNVYLACPTNDQIVEGLRSGVVSVRRAFHQSWCWVLETAQRETRVLRSWGMSINDVPDEFLPGKNRGLYHYHGYVADNISVISRSRPFISLYFTGGCLDTNIPFGVLKGLVDDAYGTVKTVFSRALSRYRAAGLSEASIARMLNIPVSIPQPASLCLEINQPNIDISFLKRGASIDCVEAIENIELAGMELIQSVSALSDAATADNLSNELAEQHFLAMDAVVNILPRDNSVFNCLEIFGENAAGRNLSVKVDAISGQRIRDAHRLALRSEQLFRGTIVEVSSRSKSFILRMETYREMTCKLGGEEADEAISKVRNGMSVSVSGYFFKRKRRDYINANSVTGDSGVLFKR